jgi:hypothetical protein
LVLFEQVVGLVFVEVQLECVLLGECTRHNFLGKGAHISYSIMEL